MSVSLPTVGFASVWLISCSAKICKSLLVFLDTSGREFGLAGLDVCPDSEGSGLDGGVANDTGLKGSW